MRTFLLIICTIPILTIASSAAVFNEPSLEPIPYESPDIIENFPGAETSILTIELNAPTANPEPEITAGLEAPIFASPLPQLEGLKSEIEEPEVTPFILSGDSASSRFSFSIDLTHGQSKMYGAVDSAVRSESAKFTGTEPSDWKLMRTKVLKPSPTPSTSTIPTVLINQPPSAGRAVTELIGTNRQINPNELKTWRTVYEADLPEEAVPAYENYVSSGGLANDIRDKYSLGFVQAKLLEPATKISSRVEWKPAAESAEDEELLLPDSDPPPEEVKQEQNAGPNTVAVAVSLTGVVVAIVAVAGMAVWAVRRRNSDDEFSPPSNSCSLSAAAAEQRATSIGPPPELRGADALRAHAGILSWQENAAAEAESYPLSPPPPPPPPGSTYVRQNQPAPYVPKVNSKGSGSSSSAYAPHTGTTSSAYDNGTPRTSSEDGTVESSEIVPDSEPRTSEASTAFAVGTEIPHSVTSPELMEEPASPTQHTFVNLSHDFGDPK